MNLLLPGENLVHSFFAEVRESRAKNELNYCLSNVKGIEMEGPDSEVFTAQILLTTARMIFFEPTNKDIEAIVVRDGLLEEVIYQAFFLENIYRFVILDNSQIEISLISPWKSVLSIPKANSWRIVTEFLRQTLFCSEHVAPAPWNFAFTFCKSVIQKSEPLTHPRSISEKPNYSSLATRWNSYFECFLPIQAIDRDLKQVESLLNSPISSEHFLRHYSSFTDFHSFATKLKQIPLKVLLPLEFLLEKKRNPAQLILSLANSNYQLCSQYSALFVTPNINLSKPQYFLNGRFPIVAFGRIMRCGQISCENVMVNASFEQTLQMLGKERLLVFELGSSNMTFGQITSLRITPIEQLCIAFNNTNQCMVRSVSAVDSIEFECSTESSVADQIAAHLQRLKAERDERTLAEEQNTHWSQIVYESLMNARRLALASTDPRVIVLVCGTDEQQYGGILICLTEVLLNPEARTARGLSKCIRKHLEHAGFVFKVELFILLLDAVSHLVQTEPQCFAFSDAFLARFALRITSGQYGNFYFKNECERVASGVTVSSLLLDASFELDFEGKLEDVDFDLLQGFVNLGSFWRLFE